jgi:hypothetical protein
MPAEIEEMPIRLTDGQDGQALNLFRRADHRLKARSKKSTNALAFAVAERPVGNTAQRSRGDRLHSDGTARTALGKPAGKLSLAGGYSMIRQRHCWVTRTTSCLSR